MKRVILSSVGIGMISVFLFLNLLDPISILRQSVFALVWYCVFWYGIFGSVLVSGLRALRAKAG